MTKAVHRTVLVPHSLKARATEAKWLTKTTVSDQIQAIIDDIVAGRVTTSRRAPEESAAIRYTVDPAQYDLAAQAAAEAGLTLSEVVRDELTRRLDVLGV